MFDPVNAPALELSCAETDFRPRLEFVKFAVEVRITAFQGKDGSLDRAERFLVWCAKFIKEGLHF